MSSTGQTTYDRAKLEYDKDHEAALLEAITRTIVETSVVSDVNASVLRSGETAEALITILAGGLSQCRQHPWWQECGLAGVSAQKFPWQRRRGQRMTEARR
jgi:hypothetical protein